MRDVHGLTDGLLAVCMETQWRECAALPSAMKYKRSPNDPFYSAIYTVGIAVVHEELKESEQHGCRRH